MKFKTKEGVIYQVNDECIDGITFKELAEKAKSNSSAYGGHFCTMFGKTVTEITDLILKYEEGNIKMTREEALFKLGGDTINNVSFIKKLEALGLIKFDEPKILKIFEEITPDNGRLILYQNEDRSYEVWYHGRKVWTSNA